MRIETQSNAARGIRQGFEGRIIVIVLGIITLSQVLGTFLSVLSFEKIFLNALTDKYEILGKDLSRKVERGLGFGKPLERFVGMDKLAKPLFRYSPDLNEIFVANEEGRILFTFRKTQVIISRGAVEEKENPIGKVLMSTETSPQFFPVDELFDWKHDGPLVRLYQERYYVMFSIKPRFGGPKGILGLVFKRSVLNEKKQELIRSSRNKLGAAVLLTALMVAFMIRFMFVAPARRKTGRIAELTDGIPANGETGTTDLPQEILEVQLCVTDFVAQAQLAKSKVSESLTELKDAIPEDSSAQREIDLMREIIDRTDDDKD